MNLNLIKESFEQWYNSELPKGSPKRVAVLNYSDEQTLKIKAYHKVTVSLMVVGIKENLHYTIPIIELSEHYNHGVTTPDEAQEEAMKHFLVRLFDYCSSNKIIN